MKKPNDKYNEFAWKWLNGTITEEEKNELVEWLKEHPSDPLYIPPSLAKSEEQLRRRILKNTLQLRKADATIPFYQKKQFLRIAAASVILILVSLSVYSYLLPHHNAFPAIKAEAGAPDKQRVRDDIAPGRNKAILVFTDGSRIELDSADNGTIASDPSTKVIKVNSGQLRFSSTGSPETTGYITLATPCGGQYALTLADGTRVWLNSTSSLRFPGGFAEKERVVELSGEAYFEVVKNPLQPFIVKVNDTRVKVLGTHFNVKAYPDEEAMQTTLLEGSVRVEQNQIAKLLKPGQQAAVKPAGTINVKDDADVDQVIAWKNGLFGFEDATIETIMKQLARWYPIQVNYAARVPEHFTGTISKNVGIKKVFQMLELTGAVHFFIDGNKVTVQK